MKEKKGTSRHSRRNLLKSIAAGSGAIAAGKNLPDSWARPVVDAVLLPAHAQTSCTTAFAGTYTGNATATVNFCDGTNGARTPPVTVIIGANCSVSVSYTGIRPFTGTGSIVGNTFSVPVSRTELCGGGPGSAANDGTGLVTGTVSGTQISGTAVFGGSCDCGTPAVANFSSNDGIYTINLA